MREHKKIVSSRSQEIFFIVRTSILLGGSLCVVSYFTGLFLKIQGIAMFFHLLEWPVGMFLGIGIAVILAVFRRTKVEIVGNSVIISRIAKKWELPVTCFSKLVVKRTIHIRSVFKEIIIKVYLAFMVSDEVREYRLFEFSEKDLEMVVQCIQESRISNMTVEEKISIQDSIENAEEEQPDQRFCFPAKELKKKEMGMILKIGGIWALLAAILLFVSIDGFIGTDSLKFQSVFCLLIAGLLILSIPFQILQH